MAKRRYTKRIIKRGRPIFAKKKVNFVGSRHPVYRQLTVGFPKKFKFTHKYCDQVLLTSTSGLVTYNRIRANGMFDPDQSGTGHQPLYFDNLSNIYDHYVVIGSKITCKFMPSTTTAQVPIAVGVYVADSTVVPSTFVAFVENQKSKYAVIGGLDNPSKTVTCSWSAKKFFGGSILANTELQGTSAADPTEQSYFDIYCCTINNNVTTTVQCIYTVEYIAIWKELKTQDYN